MYMPPSGMVGTTMKKKKEPFMDVYFANYAALLAEVLSVLVWAVSTWSDGHGSVPAGLTINWAKTKI